jgi:hypothetical protein
MHNFRFHQSCTGQTQLVGLCCEHVIDACICLCESHGVPNPIDLVPFEQLDMFAKLASMSSGRDKIHTICYVEIHYIFYLIY